MTLTATAAGREPGSQSEPRGEQRSRLSSGAWVGVAIPNPASDVTPAWPGR